ncbi:MAG: hypothetical protein ABMA14_17715 [Hyphomonadaceae bacterium]
MQTKYLDRATLLASISSIVLFASPCAFAQADDSDSAVSQAGAVELTYDHTQSGQDVVAATIEYGLGVRIADGWTIHMDAVVEPVEDPLTDVAFHSEDAYIETLSLQYSGENFSVYAGKINPVFGSAADLAPGLYGAEIGEAYQITEQTGFGGDISLSSLLGFDGEYVLSAAVFTADRSFLSGSLGGHRNRVLLSDGGLANTSELKSYAVSLDGSLENGFGYSVGYRHLASETPGEADESMTVAGVSYAFPEDLGFSLATMAEVGMSRDADGNDGANRDFYTAAAEIGFGDWFVNVVASGWNENAVAGDLDLRKFEVSIGRNLTDDLTLEFGAQDARFGGESETILGLRLSYSFG